MIWMAALSALSESKQNESALKIKQYETKTNAEIAKMNASMKALNLTQAYNDSMATNAVIGASQGRSGPSIQGIYSAAGQELNWDIEYNKLGTNLSYNSALNNIATMGRAIKTTRTGGLLNAVAGGYQAYDKYKKIK